MFTLLLLGLFADPKPIIPTHITDRQEIIKQKPLTPRELVKVKGKEYNVSVALMEQIISCESQWNTDAQSKHVYKTDRPREGVKKGERERSFGLVQIHLPAHRNITKKQATNPEFAIDFLAKNISLGKGKMWSCYPKKLKPISL